MGNQADAELYLSIRSTVSDLSSTQKRIVVYLEYPYGAQMPFLFVTKSIIKHL